MERRRTTPASRPALEAGVNAARANCAPSVQAASQEVPTSNHVVAGTPRHGRRWKLCAITGLIALVLTGLVVSSRNRGGLESVLLHSPLRRAKILELDDKEQFGAANYPQKLLENPQNLSADSVVAGISSAKPMRIRIAAGSLQRSSAGGGKTEPGASGTSRGTTPVETKGTNPVAEQSQDANQGQDVNPANQSVDRDGKGLPFPLNILEQNRTKCPLRYDRIPYEDIASGRYQPYLLGERAKPACNNCDRDKLWSHFCQFQTHGPVCPGWLKWQLSSDWRERAELDSPGMKERLTLTPCDLFPFIRDRTLWLIGDSLTLEWDKAVHCFLFEFWDLELRDLKAPTTTVKDFQGWCAHMAQNAKVCFVRGNTGNQFVEDVLPNLAALGAKPTDLMVLNFAVWQNKEAEHRNNITLFANYYQKHKTELPIAIWRDAPVQHFHTFSGDYIWPIPSNECKAIPEVDLLPDNTLVARKPSAQILVEGGWRNKIALPIITRLGIPVMHTWNQTLPMWQYHTHYNTKEETDCTHMCHPSEYQYWVFELYKTLKSMFPLLAVSQL